MLHPYKMQCDAFSRIFRKENIIYIISPIPDTRSTCNVVFISLKTRCACSTEETFIQDLQEILKQNASVFQENL